jgi:hypothetical protein
MIILRITVILAIYIKLIVFLICCENECNFQTSILFKITHKISKFI